jgi:hypothetical protein
MKCGTVCRRPAGGSPSRPYQSMKHVQRPVYLR